MSYPDPVAWPMAQALLGCLTEEIAKVRDPPASVGMRTGQRVDALLSVNEDECCSGLAWVRINDVYPTGTELFPLQDQVAVNCAPYSWAVELEMGAVRCAPTPDVTEIPTNLQWEDLAEKIAQDAAAMRRAVVCCFPPLDVNFLLGRWQPLPTGGRCAGGTQMVTLAAEWVDCCAEPDSP